MTSLVREEEITLPGGPRLALRRAEGEARPFLLVHGLASNARLWDAVGRTLADAGHEVVAVDLRGHGRSEQVTDGYTTGQCGADLAALCKELGITGPREPIVAGQSWGGNVVLTLAAEHGGVAGLALVDGGWIWLGRNFATFEECWAELAPPVLEAMTMTELRQRAQSWWPDFPAEGVEAQLANFVEGPDGFVRARLRREHHKQILASLWAQDPRPLFAQVRVPTLIAVAGDSDNRPGPELAAAGISHARTSRYLGAHHDLHAQHPERLARELLQLAAAAEGQRA